MNLFLTEEQKMIQETAREFAKKKVLPIASDIDKNRTFPKTLFKELSDSGLLGLMFGAEYGGLDKGRFGATLLIEELSAVSASFAWSVAANISAGYLLQTFGSEEQKKKYLSRIVKGELVIANAITEPSSGTNWVMSLTTTARKNNDDYIVNGGKCFISNAEIADLYLTFVRTNPEKGPNGISILLIEKGTQGFSFGKKEDKLGLKGVQTGELFFDKCKISNSNLIGGEGNAISMFLVSGTIDSIFQASVLYGIARAAFEHTINYVKERKIGASDKYLSSFDSVQGAISDMTISLEAMRLIVYRGALALPGPDPHPILSAKYCNDAALSMIDKCFSLYGAYGCITDFPIERYYRDAKTMSVQKSFDFVRSAMGKMILGVS